MKSLTRAEESVMQILWEIEKGFVKEIVEKLPDNPAYNTISTIIRILEKKGFVAHQSYGKSHQYYPLVSKSEYSKKFFNRFVGDYFNGSVQGLLSFFVKNQDIDIKEVEELLQEIKKKK